MENCVFCRIASGEIPCYKLWENDDFLAFLDINPVTEGMTLVIPKKHKNSYIFNNDDEDISKIMEASKKVSKLLDKALNIIRVGIIFEGFEVSHLHAKLIPIRHGENLKTILGSYYPKPDNKQLEEIANKISLR